MYTITDLYDLEHTLAKDYLSQFTYPWEALKGIKDFILALGPTLGDDYEEVAENVWVHKTATVFPSAYLGAPCIHHRSRDRGQTRRVHQRLGACRRKLRCRQLRGTEKRHSL